MSQYNKILVAVDLSEDSPASGPAGARHCP